MGTTKDSIEQIEERRPLSPQQAALWGVGVASYLLAAWLLVQRGLTDWLSGNPSLNFYFAQPAIWSGLAVVSYMGWRRLPDPPSFSRILTGIAVVLGVAHVGLLVFAGVFSAFGDSYVAGEIANYPRNLWFVGTWLFGLEMARAFLFHAWRPFGRRWAFVASTVLLSLVMTPYGQLRAVFDRSTVLATLAAFIVPTIILSILLTWLVEHGGPGPAIGYRFVLLAFEWFSRVQPDLDWPFQFVIGVAAPIVAARMIGTLYLDTEEGAVRWAEMYDAYEKGTSSEGQRRLPFSWLVTALLVALIALGAVFGYRPAVVAGVSMEPTYERGDMAILQRDIDPASLEVGDVIEFHDARERSVIHRIVAVESGRSGPVFTTKGDNNAKADPAFTADVIVGKVVFLVPLLGWPAIWLRGG